MTIYYKNSQLDKYRTLKSVTRYYVSSWIKGERPRKPVIESSLKRFETF